MNLDLLKAKMYLLVKRLFVSAPSKTMVFVWTVITALFIKSYWTLFGAGTVFGAVTATNGTLLMLSNLLGRRGLLAYERFLLAESRIVRTGPYYQEVVGQLKELKAHRKEEALKRLQEATTIANRHPPKTADGKPTKAQHFVKKEVAKLEAAHRRADEHIDGLAIQNQVLEARETIRDLEEASSVLADTHHEIDLTEQALLDTTTALKDDTEIPLISDSPKKE